MRVLWVIPAPVSGMEPCVSADKFSLSGTWITAAVESCVNGRDFHLAIATLSCKEHTKHAAEGIMYYGIPLPLERGKVADYSAEWERVLLDFKPDLIQLSGTEYSFGVSLIHVAKKMAIPVVASIHGVMSAIAKYPVGMMNRSQFLKSAGLLSAAKSFHYYRYHRNAVKQAQIEGEILRLCDGIIIDSEWERAFCCDLAGSGVKTFPIPLPLERVYFETSWDSNNLSNKRIFCIAGRTPYKGIHDAVEALAILRDRYGIDAELVIPGDIDYSGKWVRRPPYFDYLSARIKKLGLFDQVRFLGRLSAREMADEMSKSSIFIMPSCIENQSATLRQAMVMGIPSIASMVGSCYEIIRHGENGFLYRYGENEVLAYYISCLLNDLEAAQRIGASGKVSLRNLYKVDTSVSLYEVYLQLLKDIS